MRVDNQKVGVFGCEHVGGLQVKTLDYLKTNGSFSVKLSTLITKIRGLPVNVTNNLLKIGGFGSEPFHCLQIRGHWVKVMLKKRVLTASYMLLPSERELTPNSTRHCKTKRKPYLSDPVCDGLFS